LDEFTTVTSLFSFARAIAFSLYCWKFNKGAYICGLPFTITNLGF